MSYDKFMSRGKILDAVPALDLIAGEWVQGAYHPCPILHPKVKSSPSIFVKDDEKGYCGWVNVNFVTVGQCTGLPDKKNKQIFEGDVLVFKDWLREHSKKDYFCAVVWQGNAALFDGKGPVNHSDGMNLNHILSPMQFKHEAKIVGNIHDNPDILGKYTLEILSKYCKGAVQWSD